MKSGRLLAHDTPQALMSASDPDVAALMAMPKRQAERIRIIMEGHPEDGRRE
jgi:hypothetical protein